MFWICGHLREVVAHGGSTVVGNITGIVSKTSKCKGVLEKISTVGSSVVSCQYILRGLYIKLTEQD